MRDRSNNSALLAGLMACALVCSVAVVLAGSPFAPKITPPEKMESRDMWVGMIEQWQVPDEKTVAVPAYPGAFVVACIGAAWMESNDVKTATLPAITLATEDEQEKVTAFFKEKLADWHYKNAFDMFDVFWTGSDEFNNMDIEQAAVTPNVTIMAASAAQTDFMPTAKTAIVIVYKTLE